MQINITILLAFFCLNVQAQKTCAKYDTAMKNGYEYLSKKKYDKALIEFQAAQIAGRECGIAIDKAADELRKVFQGLSYQRDEAINAKMVAVKSDIETKRALEVAKKEKIRADSALSLANKLVNTIYFYGGKFALALKSINGKLYYGFVDKRGDAVIDYKYVKAEQFDNTGFAKVKKKYEDNSDSLINFLLDTTGKEYKVAYKLSDLSKDVTALDLRGERLDRFPLEIIQHTQLLVLLLGEQSFLSLPAEIGQLTALQILDLSVDSLPALPPEIGQLKNLQTLNLSYNTLRYLPPELGQLKALRTLNLIGHINLYNEQFRTLPPEIGQLKALQKLNLSQNHLEALPAEIGQLTALQILNLNNNQLTDLPAEIGQLKNLQELDLGHRETHLQTGILQLKLRVFPAGIGQLKNLQVLNLYNNQLTDLPPEIGQLKNLRMLDLGGVYEENFTNKLVVLPTQIGQLKALKTLNLTGNPISESEINNIQLLLPQCVINSNYPSFSKAERQSYSLIKALLAKRILYYEFEQLLKLQINKLGKNQKKVALYQIANVLKNAAIDNDTTLKNSIKLRLARKSTDLFENVLSLIAPNDSWFKNNIANVCGGISFSIVLLKDYSYALKAAQIAYSANPNEIIAKTNLPLSYLLMNQYKKAEKLYLEFKDEQFKGNRSYKEAFLEDFNNLESKGITHPDFNRIRQLLNQNK